MLTRLLALSLLSLTASAQSVCYVGYIMDDYCIRRGTLFDNPSLSTLQNAAQHSVHCLLDVQPCAHSSYKVLDLTANVDGKHCSVYELDETGKQLAIDLATQTGICSTCSGSGTISHGFSATVIGTPTSTGGGPIRLAVTQVLPATTGCSGFGGQTVPTAFNCNQGQDQPLITAHGSLMLTSWGVMLPSGVILARFLKHREGAIWFHIHRALQTAGLVISIVGWGIALSSFDVFFASANMSFTGMFVHGLLGCITMCLGILQPINALLRPHPEPRDTKRIVWEYYHKASGYTAVGLGLYTVYLGTTFVPVPGTQTAFQTAFFVGLGLVATVLCLALFDQYRHNQKQNTEELASSDAVTVELPVDVPADVVPAPKEVPSEQVIPAHKDSASKETPSDMQ